MQKGVMHYLNLWLLLLQILFRLRQKTGVNIPG